MNKKTGDGRRNFLRGAGSLGAALLASSRFELSSPVRAQQKAPGGEEQVSPAEDLMREHGVLNRVLLIYDEALRRLRAAKDIDAAVLLSSAGIIRSFIEDYHEKLEEDYLFPRFEKAAKLVELVRVLREQHRAGRRLTDRIRGLASAKTLKDPTDRTKLAETLRLFLRMYRPHEAREDTVLFPAFRSIVTPNEYDSLGEEFEDREHQLFGEEGFEKIVDDVAKLEKQLGLYDLSQYTPKA